MAPLRIEQDADERRIRFFVGKKGDQTSGIDADGTTGAARSPD
jgi:hypothetical protein